MKHPTLLDVPRTHPSRKDRLNAFKAKHGIETHNCGRGWTMNKPDEWSKWMAMLMPACRKLGYGVTETSGMAEIGAKVGRLVYDGATPNPAGDSSGTGRSSK